MNDLISRQDALRALSKEVCGDKIWAVDARDAIEGLPSAEPEIIYCKDCKKHNMQHGHYYKGKYIGVKECCPLVFVRGLAQGHEFDYQYCVWAERRTDGQTD